MKKGNFQVIVAVMVNFCPKLCKINPFSNGTRKLFIPASITWKDSPWIGKMPTLFWLRLNSEYWLENFLEKSGLYSISMSSEFSSQLPFQSNIDCIDLVLTAFFARFYLKIAKFLSKNRQLLSSACLLLFYIFMI